VSDNEVAIATPWPLILKDRHFHIALLIGPVTWALLGDIVAFAWPSAVVFFTTVVLYPLVEEFAFRGTIQTWISDRVKGAETRFGLSLANLATSVFFALAHLIYQPVYWALATFFPSLVFGYFRDRFDRVLPGVILHSWYNFGFLLFVVGQA
jgi:membrane protease YdiL (CAAX protease family)